MKARKAGIQISGSVIAIVITLFPVICDIKLMTDAEIIRPANFNANSNMK